MLFSNEISGCLMSQEEHIGYERAPQGSYWNCSISETAEQRWEEQSGSRSGSTPAQIDTCSLDSGRD